jgi:DNA-binding response OmpR family regulator
LLDNGGLQVKFAINRCLHNVLMRCARILDGGNAMQILVVEDDREIALQMCAYLKDQGHLIDVVEDGVSGMYQALFKHYDAIVINERLPGMGGIALCRELRKDNFRRTPILMLSDCNTLDKRVAALDAGANEFMLRNAPPRAIGERLRMMFYRYSADMLDAYDAVAAHWLADGRNCGPMTSA